MYNYVKFGNTSKRPNEHTKYYNELDEKVKYTFEIRWYNARFEQILIISYWYITIELAFKG